MKSYRFVLLFSILIIGLAFGLSEIEFGEIQLNQFVYPDSVESTLVFQIDESILKYPQTMRVFSEIYAAYLASKSNSIVKQSTHSPLKWRLT